MEIKPIVRFSGNALAERMGTVFSENLADLRAKVDDGKGAFPRGFLHTSTVPHPGTCYYDQVWARDSGRGLQELARWGFFAEALPVAEYLLSHKNFGDHWGRLVDRDIGVDYELDGNTHILNGIRQTWIASGKDKTLGRRFLDGCMPVFHWFEKCMDECPIGDLIPCISELAGNPCEPIPVYAIYPNFGAYASILGFASLAADLGAEKESGYLSALADRLKSSLLPLLRSKGTDESPVPEGVWLNGRKEDGIPYETAHFGARFGITHWTRQVPYGQLFDIGVGFLPEDELKDVHLASYRYLRHEMAKSPFFRKYGFVSNTCFGGSGGRHDDTMCGYGQNYFTQAALMVDDVNTYGLCLSGISRLAYDGDVVEPMAYEMNPWILHECFSFENYEKGLDHTFGTFAVPEKGIADNDGDEGNLVQAAETLKTIAMAVGVSMENGVLTVCPRLPWEWNGMTLENYPVTDSDGTVHRIGLSYTHDRAARTCSFCVFPADGIKKARVRFGPFPRVLNTKNDLSGFTVKRNGTASFLRSEEISLDGEYGGGTGIEL